MDAGELTIIGTFAIPLVATVAYFTHQTIKNWHETALKRDMVARGYTANEIIDVIAGVRSAGNTLGDIPPAKPIKQPV